MKNEVQGLLSFFFIQGQTTLPYVRLPTWDTHLDLRVHVFWIQPSRTGKSIAWNFISDIMEEAEIPFELFASGTDAGLIGSTEQEFDENGKPTGDVKIVSRVSMKVLFFLHLTSTVKKLYCIYRQHVTLWVVETIHL